MITLPIGLDPVALSLGGVEIRWYGIAAVATAWLGRLALRAGRTALLTGS